MNRKRPLSDAELLQLLEADDDHLDNSDEEMDTVEEEDVENDVVQEKREENVPSHNDPAEEVEPETDEVIADDGIDNKNMEE